MSKFMARYTNFMQTYSIYGQTWPDKTKFLARSMQVFKYASMLVLNNARMQVCKCASIQV